MNPTVLPSKNVALLDWDNSLRDGWVILDWAAQLAHDGLISAEVVIALLRISSGYQSGELSYSDFAGAAPRVFADGLRHADAKLVLEHAGVFVRQDPVGLRPFAAPLLAALRERSIAAVIVSGAPQEILDASLEHYHLDAVFGTTLEEHAGKYSGAVEINRALAPEKETVVAALQHGGNRVVVGVGDSESDMPLLSIADVPVVIGNAQLAARLPASLMLESDASDVTAFLDALDR